MRAQRTSGSNRSKSRDTETQDVDLHAAAVARRSYRFFAGWQPRDVGEISSTLQG